MTSNARVQSSVISNSSMAGTLTTEWFNTLFNQRFGLATYWTGSPNGTLYIDVGIGNGSMPNSSIWVPTILAYDTLSSMVVTAGLTTQSESQWFVSGANDWEYIRLRWVPTGTTTGSLTGVLGCFKSQG